MTRMTRRLFGLAIAAALAASFAQPSAAADKEVRIGYQKYGTLILLKNRGLLEEKLKPLGYSVAWSEFPSGPPLLEALNAGAIDFGHAGESPPIFAQAASSNFVYIGYEPPAPQGEAVLVPMDSPIKSIEDLKGKTIGLNKGSNVHFLLVKLLEKHGLSYSDIKPAYLAPADARAAFEKGSIDAWVIWDPYQASAELATKARTLANGEGVVPNYQFYFGDRRFVEEHPDVVKVFLKAIAEVDDWARGNTDAVAKELSPATGIPAPVLAVALKRQSYGVKPIDDAVIADQQKIADTFHDLKLLPKTITVSDAIGKSGS